MDEEDMYIIQLTISIQNSKEGSVTYTLYVTMNHQITAAQLIRHLLSLSEILFPV